MIVIILGRIVAFQHDSLVNEGGYIFINKTKLNFYL